METGLSPVRIGHPIEPILLAGGLPALPGSNLKPGKPVKSRPFHNSYYRFLPRITISANDRQTMRPRDPGTLSRRCHKATADDSSARVPRIPG